MRVQVTVSQKVSSYQVTRHKVTGSHSPSDVPGVALHVSTLLGHVKDVAQVPELRLVREELTVSLKVLQHRRVVRVDGLEEGEGEGVRR